jgi:hypothetical protein
LVISDVNTIDVVVFTAGSRPREDGRMEPMLRGQMRDGIPYLVDVVGFLYMAHAPEDGTLHRSMLVQPTPNAIAKDGTDRLPGPTIANPNLTELFALLNGHQTVQADQIPPQPQQTGVE